jgi:predicted peroxiredoxin
MTESYLLFESRDPFESAEVPHHYELARGLAAAGKPVALFLVQNGVLAARRSAASEALARLAGAGVEILADDFSLRERGIPRSRLEPAVRIGTMDLALDRLVEGRKAIFF